MRFIDRTFPASPWFAAPALLAAAGAAALTFDPAPAHAKPRQRSKTSRAWRKAAARVRSSVRAEASADWFLALARIDTLPEDEREDALDEAREEFRETKSLANEQYHARLDLAADLEEGDLYSVAIDPADFVSGVSHPLMPLTPGNTWTYQAETEDGTETIVVTVLGETRTILGVTCTVVRDTVSIGGDLVEDTHDWFAQDAAGNVWYFGEISLNYEDGQISDVDGSWEAGVDGAQPGIVMLATPAVDTIYRQEFYLGEAEDYGQVLSLTASATVPFGAFTNCLQTFDGSPMEPDAAEHKFYAPNVGLVLEVDPESGERVELISFTTD